MKVVGNFERIQRFRLFGVGMPEILDTMNLENPGERKIVATMKNRTRHALNFQGIQRFTSVRGIRSALRDARDSRDDAAILRQVLTGFSLDLT